MYALGIYNVFDIFRSLNSLLNGLDDWRICLRVFDGCKKLHNLELHNNYKVLSMLDGCEVLDGLDIHMSK